MKAAVITKPFEVKIIDTEIPSIKDDEALVKVIYAGICGTDIDIYKDEAHFQVKYPHIAGHEWSGIIESVGKNVKYLKPGDRVVGDGLVSCNICNFCVYGDYSHCPNAKSVGTSEPSVDGAFREYTVLPERHLFKIPEGVKLIDAVFAEPAGVAARSLEQANAKPGQTVLVYGTGAIGFIAVQYARLLGARMVILAGRNDKKLKVGSNYSFADHTVNVRTQELKKELGRILNGGQVDIVVEASGNIQALKEALEIAGRFGKVTIPGSYHESLTEIDISIFPSKELGWIFINGIGGAEMFYKILNLMETGRLNTNGLISDVYSLEEFSLAMKSKLASSDSIKTIIKVDSGFKE